ncbi:cysteine desulfurase family protein [Staphylococcus coagulans]|uniref:cysteine desulfurase family protein n=1 Tax=Staphylococcus coagulans TaxID=74706 RepID=UPI0029292852|nr:cysteine desulfurase family protein [Staphylococcus coagulans]MDU9267571.1 cysteine desulfurase family protein [Staphylococcus coagulans]MDU9279469.1 cysteine desulfurase family protein [Staphylococcus coagulans]MDU9291513.1 cysteine desulfurase family protein [Staphylococcus coagulans]MDU9303836.1 cysteine desulfurase family protein [Staphylococcus coagulans]MDU9320894.1 cysteine desulfurase family protein [Staphylococcus coagulans]
MGVYADYAATTPVKPEVVDKMMTVYQTHFGNPSSIHSQGRDARSLLDASRRTVANYLNAQPNEVVFTSGATESNNTIIKGIAYANQYKGKHLITTKIEHHSVLNVFEYLEQQGFEVTYLDVTPEGLVDIEQLRKSLREDTTLVSIMFVNNEVGTVQHVYDIQQVLAPYQAYFHMDAVQAVGHLPLDVEDLKVDALSMTAHKFGGPKGVGVLYIKNGTRVTFSQLGGEQETKRRAGTENLAQIVGLAEALKIAESSRDDNNVHLAQLREHLLVALQDRAIPFEYNGSMIDSTNHIINLYFPFIDVETLLTLLDLAGIYVSSGSACTAGSTIPSHVLLAMFGENSPRVNQSVRISINEQLTARDMQLIATEIQKIYLKFKEENT